MEPSEIDAFQVLENVDVKVGKCNIQHLMGILTPCMRQFYMEYRKDPNVDCWSNYKRMRNCVKKEVIQCFEGVDIKNGVAEDIAESVAYESLPAEDAIKFCERSGVDASLPLDGIEYCNAEFYAKSESLTTAFNSLYNQNRGSPSLCQDYEAYGKTFLELSKGNCRPSLCRFMEKQMKWAETREQNPFCSDEQVLERS